MVRREVIGHEWRLLARDRAVWALSALFAALLAYGFHGGQSWMSFQAGTIQSARNDEMRRLEKLKHDIASLEAANKPFSRLNYYDPRNVSAVNYAYGFRWAALPPLPVAALSIGQSDLMPTYFRMTHRGKHNFLQFDELENPNKLQAGRFDLAFVLVYLYPLLILALGYNAVSNEREQGTLPMLLSHQVPLRRIVAVRFLLRGGLAFLLTAVFSVAGLALAGTNLLVAATIIRLSLFIALVAAITAFWSAIAMAVNSFGASSAANALTLAAIWLGFVVVIPSAMGLLVTSAYPAPSRVEMIQTIREATNAANEDAKGLLAGLARTRPELHMDDTALDLDSRTLRSIAVTLEVERRIQPIVEEYDRQLIRQQEAVNRWRSLSPAILVQEALNDIAGTGSERYRHFLVQVDRYHAQWRSFFLPKLFRNAVFQSQDVDRIPGFNYREEDSGAYISRILAALGSLAVLTVLVGVLGLRGMKPSRVCR